MKTPLNWISIYTPLDTLTNTVSITKLAHEYSIHTAEIDGIEEHFLDHIVIGKVISCTKHPDSTKLSIVEVDLGKHGKEIILTGAPNIVEATYVGAALVGAVLPGNFVIGERRMAGMMSRGMICGADEIGLAAESDGGIIILEKHWEVDVLESNIGASLFDLKLPFPGRDGTVHYFPLKDTTFEIDNKFITNRPDLFGVYGNAREWGAVFNREFSTYSSKPIDAVGNMSINIETPRCLTYHAMKMENITVGKSPFGIALMMHRAGMSEKMDLVDITNLILTEFGQPMHVFDADKVQGGITVRLAKTGEKLLALNNQTYELHEEDMIIADENGPIALAGVIGGLDSAVSENTKNIIWESATFDAVSVRLSAQRHGIRTDASTRYEKSLDPLLSEFALGRIFDYLKFLGKNIEVTGVSHFLDTAQLKTPIISTDFSYINRKAGVEIPKDKVQSILTKLGFEYTVKDDALTITVPSWRASKDISIKEDIAEEVIRIHGYENIPMSPLESTHEITEKNGSKDLRNLSLDYWKNQKWHEVYNYSFSNTVLDQAIGYSDMENAIGIQNAFNVEYTHMRRSLAVRLFDNIAKNSNIKESLRFFEIERVYHKETYYDSSLAGLLSPIDKKPYGEHMMIAGVSTSDTIESLKNSLESYLREVMGYLPALRQSSPKTDTAYLHPSILGEYYEGDTVILTFGQVHPETAERMKIPTHTLYWESKFETLIKHASKKEIRIQPISKYQSIPRELNFVLPEKAYTGDIARNIKAIHPWIGTVTVESVYRDAQKIGAENKSVNFTFFFTSHEHTISDEEALMVQDMVIKYMSQFGYKIRGV